MWRVSVKGYSTLCREGLCPCAPGYPLCFAVVFRRLSPRGIPRPDTTNTTTSDIINLKKKSNIFRKNFKYTFPVNCLEYFRSAPGKPAVKALSNEGLSFRWLLSALLLWAHWPPRLALWKLWHQVLLSFNSHWISNLGNWISYKSGAS